MQKKKMLLIVGLITLLSAAAFGTVLYTLTVPSTWHVNVAYGLALFQSDGTTPVTAISWTVDPLGAQTQNFVLKNTGNHDGANVTLVMPDNTTAYEFTTTFANITIPMGGTYAFSITLTDLGMDSSQQYSGSFAFLVVDHFSSGNDASPITWATSLEDQTGTTKFDVTNFIVTGAATGVTNFTIENLHGNAYEFVSWTLQVPELGNLLIAQQTDLYLNKNILTTISTSFSVTGSGALTMQLVLYGNHN
jgi:hypothetical protein